MCAIVGCSSTYGRGKVADKVGFFQVPAIITNQCTRTYELSCQRRHLWIAIINREEVRLKSGRDTKVCSKHFVQGKNVILLAHRKPKTLD